MSWRENIHSRLVAWLKIVLPLAALAILSTLFLVARSIQVPDELPFAQIDLKERARNPQATEPAFAGVTDNGDRIAINAVSARPIDGDMSRVEATDVDGRMDMNGGSVIFVTSKKGLIDQPADMTRLTGDVVITTTDGYVMKTEALNAGLSTVWAETDGFVQGNGPPGRFTAGKMKLSTDPETGKSHLLLTQRAKLIYDPRDPKE
jgi:lipopolysaccharide export system protein LptC